MQGSRGFTLVEVTVATGILAAFLLAVGAIALGSRPFAVRSDATRFDALVAAARAVAASSGNGATLAFVSGGGGAGTTARLYAGRPNGGAMRLTSLAPVRLRAEVRAKNVGRPPFAIFFSSAGYATAASGSYAPGSFLASEPPCPVPSPGAAVVTFSAGRAGESRTLPCPSAVGASP
ncbi:MAG: prepilin-type N-terminal cleavage/methylation domain-containing protein [Vulcanimicrobiaceae bacterium]